MMDFSMGMDMLPQQQMKASPTLIILNNMLVLSGLELQQLVQQELEENPALEQAEASDAVCHVCGKVLIEGVCLRCLYDNDRLYDADMSRQMAEDEEDIDPFLMVPAPTSHAETLERDLHIVLPASEHPIIAYLIGSLDEQGFLDCTLEEAATALGVTPQRVALVLEKLQELAPAGVGARTVEECLQIQINRLEALGISHPLLRPIFANHWQAFGEHRYSEIARVLGVSYEQIVAVRDFIRTYLRPFPLKDPETEGDATPIAYLNPDLIILEDGERLVVEVVESQHTYLRMNPFYQDLAHSLAQGRQDMSQSDAEHLSQFVSRAKLFLTNLRQRRETILRIGKYLVERQERYIRHGIRYLTALTRAEVAAAIGVHESTVSRATAHKYVRLPNREIVPFSHFFSASLSVKDVIQECILHETTPLTDEQLVDMLRERGYHLARRTVAKYRNQLGILPSHVR